METQLALGLGLGLLIGTLKERQEVRWYKRLRRLEGEPGLEVYDHKYRLQQGTKHWPELEG